MKTPEWDSVADPHSTMERPAPAQSNQAKLVRLEVGVNRPSASFQSLDVQMLLRRRLRIIVLIALAANLAFNAMRFMRYEATSHFVGALVPAAAYVSALAALAAVLWRRRIYTLSRLRLLEGLFFGIATIYYLRETYDPLFVGESWLVVYAQRHPTEMSILARQPSVFWMLMIIVYGTFIPNTGRRCALVTTLMALSPLTLVAVLGLLHPEIPRRQLFLFLSELAMWLSIAVAIAIYGSQKIAALREEALAARKLGQYELKSRLGKGGMGEVYLAEHVLLRRPCAVKVIRAEKAGDPSTLERFLREVQVTATLTHPNTIQVFDYGQTEDGTVFYVMEYLTGLSLQELVAAHGRMPAPRAISILRQLCGALAEAHAVGLIHRDIKPSNVILCSRGGRYDIAKLLDFGLVRVQATDHLEAAGLTREGLIFGTPSYMSPEQALGKHLDARSDIYSLGAMAQFLVTGEPPFVRDSVVQTLAAHINEPPAPLRSRRAELPADLEAIVLQCLAKDPGQRFADVATLGEALEACGSSGRWTQSDAALWWSTAAAHGPRATPVPPARAASV
jgi:tRNA A-37 threonylcarbamoyl transferase component Bud32